MSMNIITSLNIKPFPVKHNDCIVIRFINHSYLWIATYDTSTDINEPDDIMSVTNNELDEYNIIMDMITYMDDDVKNKIALLHCKDICHWISDVAQAVLNNQLFVFYTFR